MNTKTSRTQGATAAQDRPPEPGRAAAAPEERLLAVVDALARELNPKHKRALPVTLDSSLDRDLGIDSLGRAELLLRLERAFMARLPERLLGEAETPRDLLAAVLEARAPRAPVALPEIHPPQLETVEA